MSQGQCRSCGAALLWVKSETTGKNMPLDATPSPDGTIQVTDGVARVVKRMECHGDLYVSHFVTCPTAAEFRRSQPKTKETKP